MTRITAKAAFNLSVATALLVGAALRVASFNWNSRLQGDVNLFALTAREFVQHGRLYYPVKYEFSDHVPYLTLATPASQHPPLWPLLGGLLGKALRTDDSFRMLKLLSEVAGFLFLALLILAGLRLRRPRETLVALAFCALSPMLVDFSGNGSMYIALAAMVLSAAVLLYVPDGRQMTTYVLAGVLCGLGIMTHTALILLPGAFLASWVARRVSWQRILVFALALVVTLAPWMCWNWRHYGQLFYSLSPYYNLRQLGVARTGVFGDVVTTRITGPLNARVMLLYLVLAAQAGLGFLEGYAKSVGPFVLFLATAGVLALFRRERRLSEAIVLPYLLCTFTLVLWPSYRPRYLVPTLPLAFVLAGFGLTYLMRGSAGWRWLGSLALIGGLAWQGAGLLDQPPTQYYEHDASYAATYAEMVKLSQELAQLPSGIVLGYGLVLDRGLETKYWNPMPLVATEELPLDAATKVVRDFGVRYIWTSQGSDQLICSAIPGVRAVLSDGEFSVYEVPPWEVITLPPANAPTSAALADPSARARLAAPGWHALVAAVVLGDQFELLEYRVDRIDDHLLMQFVWKTRSPQPSAVQFFVNLVDSQGRMLAQMDGPLGRWPDESETDWPLASAVLQRVDMMLPSQILLTDTRICTGLYRLEDHSRLALSVDGVRQQDDCYLLPSLPTR
jgi:4-amino-4-deoxy-L-arabinose transferase-like glycosyltransferase